MPAPISSFVGREEEFRQVHALVRAERLVTLAGAGGIGKTRLAIEVARQLVDRFDGRAWLVELAPVGQPEFVPQAVLSALGMLEEAGRSVLETLQAGLRGAACLLVLDNCEHVVAAAASLARALLHACPELHILATSREPLGLNGETIWRVPPLSVPEQHAPDRQPERSAAERLFVARAAAAKPGFVLDGPEADAVRRICTCLDGIPLAIELAAAWSAFLSPAQLLSRIVDSPGFLNHTDRVAPARHATMDAAIRWSYDLLEPAERRLFGRLSVFAGSFTLEAAEVVCGDSQPSPTSTLTELRHLFTRSLVITEPQRDGSVRYRVLEPLREFGLRLLCESGEEPALRGRHAAFCLELARRSNLVLLRSAGGPWLEPLARDHDNLHAALRWLLDQARSEDSQFVGTAVAEVWRQRGQLGEARALLGELLALTEPEPSPARAGMLLLAGQLASYQGDFASARRLLEESVALCAALDLPAGQARAQGRLMEVDRAEGHYAAARARGTVMLPVAALADDPARPGFQASCHMWVALVDLAECDYAAAERETQQLLPVIEANGWTRVAGYALMALGMCAAERRDLHKAHALLEASLARWMHSDRWGAVWAIIELARLAVREDDRDQAMLRLRNAMVLSRDLGDAWSLSAAVDVRAVLAAREGPPELALRLAEAAAAIRERAGIVRSPHESRWLREALTPIERSLARSSRLAAQQAGRAMTQQEVLDMALGHHRSSALTARERQVAVLVARGWSDSRIAETLVISPRTAQVHVRNILGKLGLSSRAQIAVWAVDHGLRSADTTTALAFT